MTMLNMAGVVRVEGGCPHPRDVVATLDAFGLCYAACRPLLGVGQPGETGTVMAALLSLQESLAAVPHPTIVREGPAALHWLLPKGRVDLFFRSEAQRLLFALERAISDGLPSWVDSVTAVYRGWELGWAGRRAQGFGGGGPVVGPGRTLDAFLTRVNGAHPLLTGLPDSLIEKLAGDGPSAKVTTVGASDWEESLPKSVALTRAGTTLRLGRESIPDVFPTLRDQGVQALRVYKAFDSDPDGEPHWVADLPVAQGLVTVGPVADDAYSARYRNVVAPKKGAYKVSADAAEVVEIAFGLYPPDGSPGPGTRVVPPNAKLSPGNVRMGQDRETRPDLGTDAPSSRRES